MKDPNIKECNFNVDMAPYMYGELSLSDQAAFENHLVDCPECTDEFAAISSSRYEIYEWKKLEFDPLETPRFVIPFEATVNTVSWLEKIRSIFGKGWAIPGFAFAGLVVVSTSALLLVSSNYQGPDVVANVSESKVTPPSVVIEQTAPMPDRSVAESKSTTEDTIAQPIAAPVINHSTTKRTVRRERPAGKTFAEPRQASASRVQPKAPTLNEPLEEEDNSLRLAELFEDVETSE